MATPWSSISAAAQDHSHNRGQQPDRQWRTGIGLGAQPTRSAGGDTVLQNQDIIKLIKAGLDDTLIIAEFGSSKCQFDTSTDALIQLKESGISAAVLKAMLGGQNSSSGSTPQSSTPPPSSSPELPTAYGYYILDRANTAIFAQQR